MSGTTAGAAVKTIYVAFCHAPKKEYPQKFRSARSIGKSETSSSAIFDYTGAARRLWSGALCSVSVIFKAYLPPKIFPDVHPRLLIADFASFYVPNGRDSVEYPMVVSRSMSLRAVYLPAIRSWDAGARSGAATRCTLYIA